MSDRTRSPFPHPPRAAARTAVGATLLAALVMVGLAACSHTATGFAQVTSDAGLTQLISGPGGPHAIHRGTVLHAGDVVQVLSGQATISLSSGGDLQLREGSTITVAAVSRLTAGAVLIQPAGRMLEVSAEQALVLVPSGAAQLAVGPRPADLVAKVYQGTSQLQVTGSPAAAIAAPREIDLTAATQPVVALPLHYDAADSWDRQYLAEAESISAQLAAAAAGFDAQVPPKVGDTATFYQQLVPALSGRADFVAAFDAVEGTQPGGPVATKPGNYLIASVIALRGQRGTFASRLSEEMTFLAQGAPWGFVAYDQGVTDLPGILSDVLGAIGRASLPFTGSSSNQVAIGPPPTAPAPSPSHHRTSAPTVTTVPARRATTPANTGPGKAPTTTTTAPPLIHVPVVTGPLGSILNPLLDPLIQALDNILAGKG